MKLFAYACLAGSGSAQSGDYDDRGISNAYYESVASSDYYEYDEFGNKKKKNKNQWFDNGQKYGLDLQSPNAKPSTSYWDWATALNCWPANIEADQIVYANQLAAGTTGRLEASNIRSDDVATELYPTQKWHNKGPQHVYGSYEILDRAHDASNTHPEDSDRTTNAAGSDATANYESNKLTDKHVKNGYFAGYGESAGSHGHADEILNLHQEDPVLRSGLGGLYQYGHDTWNQNNGAHNQDMDELLIKSTGSHTDEATPIRWTHYKQARHAGCLYEKAEWHYGYGTYEQIFLATYFQGYGDFNLASADFVPTWDDGNLVTQTGNGTNNGYVNGLLTDDKQGTNMVEPIWWHFFNAHILPNPTNGSCSAYNVAALPTRTREGDSAVKGISYACPTVPRGDILPSTAANSSTNYLNPENSNAIPLVMANPAYEGLGYLNFIVEYKNKDRDVGEDYLEFIDSTPAMDGSDNYDGATNANGFRNLNTYREINNCNANSTLSTNKNFDGNATEQECTGWGENLGNWSGVHGMFYYDLFMGSWLIYPAVAQATGGVEHYRTWVSYPFTSGNAAVTFSPNDYTNNFNGDIANWSMTQFDPTQNGAATWSTDHDLVVSSFPHNNLGKDFRFNLRVLQGALAAAGSTGTNGPTHTTFFTATKTGANQVYRSYYFYKINQIDIRFPYYVAYALHHENRGKTLTTNTNARTDDGLPAANGAADWNGEDAAAWENGVRPSDNANEDWCDNLSTASGGDGQCHPAGQQWWNTLNNDIVHPMTYDNNGELYRHMDTTTPLAYNRNSIMTSDDLDDYQFMHNSMAHSRSNIIPPVDLGTHSPGVNKHSANGGGEIEFHRVMGFIKQPEFTGTTSEALIGTHTNDTATNRKHGSADWCDHTGGQMNSGASAVTGDMGDNLLERTCGVDFRIVGLMNTYDERRGQRGTYQEIWVQLQYALGKGGRDGFLASCGLDNDHTDCNVLTHPMQSPHPYLHFMASEIISIKATCNTMNVNNPNLCTAMSLGPGETNNAAYGGK